MDAVHENFGRLDILVEVLGGSAAPAGGFAVLDDEHWQRELAVNLLAAVRIDRGLIPGMVKAGRGGRPHFLDPAPDAAVRRDARLCGG